MEKGDADRGVVASEMAVAVDQTRLEEGEEEERGERRTVAPREEGAFPED